MEKNKNLDLKTKTKERANIKTKTWLLIRGLTRGSFHWLDFPEKLKMLFPEDDVITIDLPGNGLRNNERSFLKISEYREDLRQQWQEKWQERLEPSSAKKQLYVIALSLGAMVMMDWVNEYPEEIEKIFLVNTSANDLTPFHQRLRVQNYLKILKVIEKNVVYQLGKKIPLNSLTKRLTDSLMDRLKNSLSNSLINGISNGLINRLINPRDQDLTPLAVSRGIEELVLEITSNNVGIHDQVLKEFIKLSEEYPVKIENFIYQLIAASQFKLVPKPTFTKVEIFVSENDRLVSSKNSFELAKRWNLVPHTHPWAGHDLVLDDPEFVLDKIKQIEDC